MKKLCLICLLLCAIKSISFAQSVPFVTIQPFAENLALGGAHVATPSSLPLASSRMEVGYGKTFWQTKAIHYNLNNLRIRLRIIPGFTLGFEYTDNSLDKYEIFDANGNSKGMYQPNEMYAGASICFSPVKALSLDITGRYIRSSLASDTDAQGFAADIRGVYRLSPMLNIGVEARNLGAEIDYGYGTYKLPSTFFAGAYGTYPIAENHKLEAAIDCGTMPAYSTGLASLGAGYIFSDMIALRAGAHISTNGNVMPTYFSFGAFFASSFFDIGAAYLTAANTFSISAKIRL